MSEILKVVLRFKLIKIGSNWLGKNLKVFLTMLNEEVSLLLQIVYICLICIFKTLKREDIYHEHDINFSSNLM